MKDYCSHMNVEFDDLSLNPFLFHNIFSCVCDWIKYGRGNLHMQKCSAKNYLKDGATNSKFLIRHLGHFGNTQCDFNSKYLLTKLQNIEKGASLIKKTHFANFMVLHLARFSHLYDG